MRRVYELFTKTARLKHKSRTILNNDGILTETGRSWTRATIHELLTNEKYIGNNVYNRTSTKLQRPRLINKPEDWVRRNGSYTPVVDPDLFAAAQQIVHDRDRHYTDEELLQLLRDLFKQHGTLSGLIINETDGMPTTSTYRHRFQSLRRAYELVGYAPQRDYSYLAINRALRILHQEHLVAITSELTAVGAVVRQDPSTDLLTINDEFTAALIISRCREIREGEYRWLIRFDTSLDPDITIGARMAPGNTTIMDYYLFPSIDVLSDQCRLAPENGIVPGRVSRHRSGFSQSTLHGQP